MNSRNDCLDNSTINLIVVVIVIIIIIKHVLVDLRIVLQRCFEYTYCKYEYKYFTLEYEYITQSQVRTHEYMFICKSYVNRYLN